LTWKTTDHHIDRRRIMHRANILVELYVGPMCAKDLLLPRIKLALPLDLKACPFKAEVGTADPGECRADRQRLRHDAFSA